MTKIMLYMKIINNANQGLKAAQLLPERQNLHNRMQAQRSLRSKWQLHSPRPEAAGHTVCPVFQTAAIAHPFSAGR
ncbi:hypothetical protein D0T84_06605 [Dysgonomonas sp. 521]|nr:hypothetical protein [Dysgonomonas sp. 521]